MKKIVFVCLFLLSLLSVFAAPTIYGSSQDILMNSCTIYSETFTIYNTEAVGRPYSLTVDSSISSWVTFSDDTIFVGPQNSKEITFFIRPPCGESGTFSLPIVIESDIDTVTYERDLEVLNVANIQVSVDKTKLESCPCNGQLIQFDVTNIGPYAEGYTISTSRYEDDIILSQSNMFIGPGLSQSGSLFVSFPCDTYGEKSFDLVITAQNSNYEAVVPIDYSINACSEFILQTPAMVEVCQYQEKNFSVSVLNNAAYTNSYVFETKGSFANGDYDITLGTQQSANISVLLEPEARTLGSQSASVEVRELFANFVAQKDIPITVRDCYDLSITDSVSQVSVCHENETVAFEIVNNGLYDEEVHLTLDGPEYVQIENPIITIQANSSTFVPVIIDGKQVVDHDSDSFTLTAVQKSAPKIYDEIKVRFVKDTFSECYGLELVVDEFDINESTTNISVGITSTGSREKVYDLGFNGTEWMSIPLSEVSITPGQTTIIPIQTQINESVLNGSYEVFLVAQTEEYVQVLPLLVHYNSDSRWMLYLFLFIVFLVILALLLLVLLLVLDSKKKSKKQRNIKKAEKLISKKETKKQAKEEKKNNWWAYILLLLLLVLLLFIIIAVVLFATQGTTNAEEINQTNSSLSEPEIIENETIDSDVVQTNTTQEDDSQNQGFFAWLGSLFGGSNNDVNQTETTNQTTLENEIQVIEVPQNETVNETTNQTIVEQQDSSESLLSKFISWLLGIFSQSESRDLQNSTSVNNTNESVNVNQTTELNDSLEMNDSVQINNQSSENQTEVLNETIKPTPRELALAEIAQFIERNNITGESQTVLFLEENTSRILDLNDFFIDPDGDNLTFTVYEKNASEVTVRLNDSFVTITPASDFVGLTQTYFTATDSSDRGAVSPELTLIIRPVEEKNDVLTYSLLILLFIIIFIIVIYFDVKIMQAQMKKNEQNKKKTSKKKTTKKKSKK